MQTAKSNSCQRGWWKATLLTLLSTSMASSVAVAQTNTGLKYPRDATAFTRMCNALAGPRSVQSTGFNTPPQQVWMQSAKLCNTIAPMGLTAAETLLGSDAKTQSYTFDQAVALITADSTVRNKIIGMVAGLLRDQIFSREPDPEVRDWATKIFRSRKIMGAKGSLDEYKKWATSVCTYQGAGYIKPAYCGQTNAGALFAYAKPPTDLIGKAGLRASLGEEDRYASAVAMGVSGALFAAAHSLIVGAAYAAGGVVESSLFAAFGTLSSVSTLGASGWAGVAAGPAAAMIFGLTLAATAIADVVQGSMVEPNLKRALGAAMTESINIRNAVADTTGSSMFIAGVISSAQDGWYAMIPSLDGEVTFLNEAGYVSKFTLSYSVAPNPVQSFSTQNLALGVSEMIKIPAGATNIVARGYMIMAGEKMVFEQAIPAPVYTCFKTYNTIFNPSWANAWPVAPPNKLKLFHEGGYVAKYQIAYSLGGSPQAISTGEKTAGWTDIYTLPENAQGVKIRGWGATGLAWEPWRQTFELNYPQPPNICVKTYGTTLNQQYATDCQF